MNNKSFILCGEIAKWTKLGGGRKDLRDLLENESNANGNDTTVKKKRFFTTEYV